MKRMSFATALATVLLVAGFAASAEDAAPKATPPTYGPGWRHEQMIQARNAGQFGPAMMSQRGPGMGYGMGRWAASGGAGGPPLKADGTIDTSRLPDWCPMKTPAPTTK